MQTTTFEAALSWPTSLGSETPALRRQMRLDIPGEGFGLLESAAEGWMLCIPDGAEVQASVGDAPIDVEQLHLEPSGERYLPLCAGLRAHVRMGEFQFEVEPAS